MTKFETMKSNIEQVEAKKVLDKVNNMVSNGATTYEVQMFLYNNWAKHLGTDSIIQGYES